MYAFCNYTLIVQFKIHRYFRHLREIRNFMFRQNTG